MKIFIKAKPRSKKAYVKKLSARDYLVAVTEAPVQGKANKAITIALANFFSLPPSQIILVSGETAKQKIFDVPLDEKTLETIGEKQVKLF